MGDSFDQEEMVEFLRSGAAGLISKNISRGMLYKSIRTVVAGQIWVSRQTVKHLVQRLRMPAPIESPAVISHIERKNPGVSSPELRNLMRLTPRELDVIRAIEQAMTNKDIAERFGISEGTVKHHLTRIFDKTGVYSRLELALFAREFLLG